MVISCPGRANFIGLVGMAIVCLAPFGTAYAQGATVSQSGAAVVADCAGGDAVVKGSGNSISFRSACRSLTVNGSGNTIQAELQSGGMVTLNGTGNRVTYTPAGGAQDASVTDNGQGNTITRVAEAPTATITGSTAAPGGLSIHGAHGETVQIGPNGIIATPAPGTGAGAVIAPGAVTAYAGNGTATGTAPAVAMAPGQLMLSGDGQNRDMPCNRAKVFISGDTKAEFGQAIDVLDHARRLGITKIAIETQPKLAP